MSIMVDSKMKSKIESVNEFEGETCSIRFKDLEDTFWFKSIYDLQEFLNNQSVERFYDKSLRKGYFDYTNENNETFRYHIKSNRGSLELISEDFVGMNEE